MPKSTKKPSSSERKCVFCNLSEDNELKYGKIYEHDGIITHYYCLLLSSNMQQRGRDEEGILGFLAVDIQKELKRGRRLFCAYCKKSGATLGCCNRKCKKVFHYPCGIKENTLHQFFGQYKSFCVTHRPKQTMDVKTCVETPEHPMCYICYDNVHCENIYQTLWAPCCKKNAWFHRDCVQQLALSAGYFFKCPLCNNKKEFQKAMLDSGIFVPRQDASWELVPNAFQELLYRHNKCNANKCICPNGREHTSANARWELILCRTCGSQGIHMGCGNLRWINPIWDCDECSTILNKNGAYHNSNHDTPMSPRDESTSRLNGSSRQSDNESNDSDVSIGIESPLAQVIDSLNRASIVLRPGPRSAKLKQLQRQAQTNTTIKESLSNMSMEQLTDILNEQQAHHSIPDDAPLSNPIASIPPFNTQVNKPQISTSNELPSRIIDDIIVVDSDEDDEVAKVSKTTSINDETSLVNDTSDCAISYMNIKISQVTSLPAEVFANVPDQSQTSATSSETLINIPQTNSNTCLMKRKADPSDVVSMIVKQINNSIDSPVVSSKRPKLDSNGTNCDIPIASIPVSLLEPQSVLRSVTGSSYKNGISLAQTALVTINGKEFVVPLNPSSIPTSSNIIKYPTPSSSDGNAGTKCAEFMYQLADNGQAYSTEAAQYPEAGRDCVDYGAGEKAKTKEINDAESSSWDTDARINRNRLMRKKVLLRDLKFHVISDDTITMIYRDKFTMNIDVDTKRERKAVNNCSFFCSKNNSRWASRVRGTNTLHNGNKIDDDSSHCGVNNESIKIVSNSDRASDKRDTHYLPNDSTHYLANGDIDNLCKYQQKEAAKENLVPDIFAQSNNIKITDKLPSPERINRRFRYEKNNENDIVTSRKYINTMSVMSDPGTSRDELRELSHSNVNQRHFTIASSVHIKGSRKSINWRRRSLPSYTNQNDIRCRVSIDLKRIQSIFDEIPNFIEMTKRNLFKYQSFDDLRMLSPTTKAMNEYELFGSLRRSKSETIISTMYNNNNININNNNNNVSKSFENYFLSTNMNDLQKHKRGRRKKRMDKHDCVR